jgi:Ion channel
VIIGAITVFVSALTFLTSLTGARGGTAAEDLWKTLLLLMTVIMVVRRVLARPEVTIQSIYGALSAYLIVGLMFASGYAAIKELGESAFFANGQPANTQTFQYFSFTTLTTLGYGDFTAAQNGGRAVAVLEALTGQVFLATLVARLVAAYRTPSPPEPAGRGRLPEDVDGPGDDEDRD